MKKYVTIFAVMILLVCAAAYFTWSYLSAHAEITNTFVVGNISLSIRESTVDSSGQNDASGKYTTEGNSYMLIAGTQYSKDPTIIVGRGSEPCYLFVKIDNQLKDIESEDPIFSTIEEQLKSNYWTPVTNSKGEAIYFYSESGDLKEIDAKKDKQEVSVFSSFTVTDDQNKITDAYNGKTIKVEAYAVQSDAFQNTSPEDIWDKVFASK